MLKKILISIVIVLLIIVGVFIWYFNNQSIKLTVLKEAYNLLFKEDEDNKIIVNLYVNQKDSYMTDYEKISSCYLRSYDNDSYQMKIRNLELVNQVSISNDNYYVYALSISFKVITSEDIIIPDCYLVLNYNNSKSLDICIGSLSLYHGGSLISDVISLSCMKGITKKIDNVLTLEGIVLKLNSKKEVVIKDITCLDYNLFSQDYKLCIYDDIKTYNDIDSLFKTSYDYKKKNMKKVSFSINGKEELVIKLGYLNHYEIPSFGLRIDYECDGIIDSLYIDIFTFFVNNERIVKLSDLTIYEYEYN